MDDDEEDVIELTPEYESRDAIPEEHRSFYREQDGKFRLALPADSRLRLDDTMGLRTVAADRKAKLDKVRRERDRLKEEMDKLREQAAADPGSGEGGKKAESDRIRQLEAKHQESLLKLKAKVDQRTAQLRSVMEEDTIIRHLPQGADRKVLVPALRDRIKTIETEDGKLVTKVFDPGSETPRMTLQDGSTEDMTPKEFMEKVVPQEFKDWFPGNRAAGGGAMGSDHSAGRGGGGAMVISRSDAKNPAKYRAAKAKAEKKGVLLEIAD